MRENVRDCLLTIESSCRVGYSLCPSDRKFSALWLCKTTVTFAWAGRITKRESSEYLVLIHHGWLGYGAGRKFVQGGS